MPFGGTEVFLRYRSWVPVLLMPRFFVPCVALDLSFRPVSRSVCFPRDEGRRDRWFGRALYGGIDRSIQMFVWKNEPPQQSRHVHILSRPLSPHRCWFVCTRLPSFRLLLFYAVRA
ncbi:unnamed protein product, partial [Ectocarpus sp. 12 AP-2014]